MKLDTTKVYYLGDLSEEQLEKILQHLKYLASLDVFDGFEHMDLNSFKKCLNQDDRKSLCYYKEFGGWSWCNNENSINALTLFTKTKNDRIAQIQLLIQELNNELIELDEEMRKLTYDKKEN